MCTQDSVVGSFCSVLKDILAKSECTVERDGDTYMYRSVMDFKVYDDGLILINTVHFY